MGFLAPSFCTTNQTTQTKTAEENKSARKSHKTPVTMWGRGRGVLTAKIKLAITMGLGTDPSTTHFVLQFGFQSKHVAMM